MRCYIRILITCACLVCLTTRFVEGGDSCLSCQNAVRPRDCDTVQTCGPDEVCYVEETVNSLGFIRFNVGCRDRYMCGQASVVGKRGSHAVPRDRRGSLILCTECCTGEFCNSAGCGSTGFEDRRMRGPICYNCDSQLSEHGCYTITRCGLDEVCKLSVKSFHVANDLVYYTSCESNQTCENTFQSLNSHTLVGRKRSNKYYRRGGQDCMLQCCDTDLCNTGCPPSQSTTTIVQKTTTKSQTTLPTTAPTTQRPLPTTTPTTTIAHLTTLMLIPTHMRTTSPTTKRTTTSPSTTKSTTTSSPTTKSTTTPTPTTKSTTTSSPTTKSTTTSSPTTSGTIVSNYAKCDYGGKQYYQGDSWFDGCMYNCTCVDAVHHRFKCTPRCSAIPPLPASCHMITIPGECCPVLQCMPLLSVTTTPAPNIHTIPILNTNTSPNPAGAVCEDTVPDCSTTPVSECLQHYDFIWANHLCRKYCGLC